MTTYSFMFLVAFTLSGILGSIIVVEGGGPNITYVHSSCGTANNTKAGMRKSALKAIDDAVYAYQGPGEKASCSSTMSREIVASAMCWGDISVQDCKNCLWNAQFRLVDHYCKYLFGAQLTLTNCYLRYEVYPFCS
ncbi:Antifungal protein ginkbilobin-like protein 1 [Linum grandiflorum]